MYLARRMNRFADRIARELGLRPAQVERTLELHDEGATVPFLARYRKEATGGLDEVQIQAILDRGGALRELEDRREAILRSIDEQGKLSPELRAAIERTDSRTALEDLYLPYKPKRRTRATMARERGLEPLAERLWSQDPRIDPAAEAQAFVDAEKDVADVEAALAGARDILAERIAEKAELRAAARAIAKDKGALRSDVAPKHKGERTRFESWYDHEEPLIKAPSHRVLALFRGEAEGVLRVKLAFPDDEIAGLLQSRVVKNKGTKAAAQVALAAQDSWDRLLGPSLDSELRAELKDRADREAIEVFGENLKNLLLAPPASGKPVVALDPGLRTGVKLAALDGTGRLLETATLYTERGANERATAARVFAGVLRKHAPALIAVGNGTGSREAEGFVREVLRELGLSIPVVSVSEQGASIYSASEVAREEFPELDVSLRGAVSIGRRLQDPLAELVKIDPKSIGVGQYQHDVDQGQLKKKLGETVDYTVNAVGVDANTASPQLLEHVSGVGPKLARAIVAHRNDNGPFAKRAQLRKVKGLGPKAFEQAAGFLRIRGADPLDDSAVHPERYEIVERMAKDLGVSVRELAGNAQLVRKIDWKRYVSGDLGEPTLRDILAELEKPGRDPRGDVEPAAFRADLQQLSDVREGMVLQGVVTNVTAFGAFVDVGVHQDGLVHVSQLSTKFIRDPAEAAKVGDRLTVRVIGVDLERKRLSLSVKALQEGGTAHAPGPKAPERRGPPPERRGSPPQQQKTQQPFNNPFAQLKNRK